MGEEYQIRRNMRTIEREIVSALIVSSDNKLFVAKKKSGGVYADCWHIPGGGVEEGEDLVSALKRELLEETGLDIQLSEAHLVDDLGHGEVVKTLKSGETVMCKMHFNVFRVDLPFLSDQIMIKLEEVEYSEYCWESLDDLLSLKHTEPSIKLFERLNLI
jgi:8-oxo-dGTP pyrophosphatase MutT (NUDIX family)